MGCGGGGFSFSVFFFSLLKEWGAREDGGWKGGGGEWVSE